MKKIRWKKQICLAAVAGILLIGVCAEQAMAYFTTYAVAQGGVTLNLEFTETVPNDKVVEKAKIVSVKNEKIYPCFVRLKVFMGNELAKLITDSDYILGTGWTKAADQYFYYDQILQPGETTTEVKINLSVALGKTAEELETEEFNVIVIQECTPVIYDQETGAAKADWSGSDYIIYED